MPTLKEEWIEKIKKVEQRNIFPKGGGMFTVMTEFYQAPDEIRYDKEMCFKVLLESNECIWNIPKEIRTKEFLTELLEKGYKGNILLSNRHWQEEDFDFVKKYLSKFEKNNKPPFDSWSTFSPSGIFKNRDMILSFAKDNEFTDKSFLIKHYGKDKEIMFALLDNNPNEIGNVLKSIKNAYFKDKDNIFKVLKSTVENYKHLPEKFQVLDDVIDFALEKNNRLFPHIPKIIIENREKAFELIKHHKNVKGEDLWGMYKDDFEIAKYMVERHGINITYFNFMKNEELLRLAAKTYNNVSYLPPTEEYVDLIREVVLRSNKEENDNNVNYNRGNGSRAHLVKDLFPQLLKEDRIYNKTVATFFENYVWINKEKNEKESNYVLERKLLLECIKSSPFVYEKISNYYKKNNDMEVLNYYIASSQEQNHNYKIYIPEDIKDEARNQKIEVEKYILNTYLSQKYQPLQKVKQPKI